MSETLVIVVAIFAYIVIAGIVGAINYRELEKRSLSIYDSGDVTAIATSILLPLGIALMISLLTLKALDSHEEAVNNRKRKADEAERHRQSEEAKRKKAEEDILKAEGIE